MKSDQSRPLSPVQRSQRTFSKLIWEVCHRTVKSKFDAIRRASSWLQKKLGNQPQTAPIPQESRRHYRFENLEDRRVLSAFSVVNTNDSGLGSLRQAMLDANANPGPDTIEFAIAGTGVQTITPLTELPAITDEVVIDGTTQPGFAGSPLIEISGVSAGTSANGFTVYDAGTIKGFIVNEFATNGIYISASDVIIADNYLGTNSDGTQGLGGGNINARGWNGAADGIQILNNVISGNSEATAGIYFDGPRYMVIQGNKIGTDVTGTVALPNQIGINFNAASHILIGGALPGQGNLISGNNREGIDFYNSFDNQIYGNLIGTDVTGENQLSNSRPGISVRSSDGNEIGGPLPEMGNLISGNLSIGITIDSDNNLIENNLIGTNIDATSAIGNRSGISLGGSWNTIANNVISASYNGQGIGLTRDAQHNVFTNNFIGTDPTATEDFGNSKHGIEVFEYAGSPTLNLFQGNVIAFNGGNGIHMTAGSENSILSNSIFSNKGLLVGSSGLGIDLGPAGITSNDAGDSDSGVNNLQNFPLLTSVVTGGGNTTIQGTINSLADSEFRIEFFSSAIGDASGFGEGQTFLGSVDVLTSGENASFTFYAPVDLADGRVVSATATRMVDHDGDSATASVPRDTSEFARGIVVGAASNIGTFEMPFAGKATVGIYRADGQLVRTLYEAVDFPAGPLEIYWDGRDEFGNELIGGDFEWRAIAHQAELIDDGSVGDMGDPPFGVDENSHFPSTVAVDPAGNVFESSFYEEAASELRKWDANGNAVWALNAFFSGDRMGVALAADSDFVYVALENNGENRIYRVSSVDGSFSGWTGLSAGIW